MRKYKILPESYLENRMQAIAEKIISVSHYPELPIEVKVYESSANAFTTGGKYVYVSTGLITEANTEDEIACIIGHEIAHATAGHVTYERRSGRRWTVILSQLSSLVFKGDTAQNIIKNGRDYLTGAYSRRDEREADVLGTIYAQKAGYDALRGIDFHVRAWKEEKKVIDVVEQRVGLSYVPYSLAKRNYEMAKNMYANYQIVNPSYANSYYYSSVLPAKQGYETARQNYIRVCKQYEHTIRQVSPLFRGHPPAPERVKLISHTVKALEGNRQHMKNELYIITTLEEIEGVVTQPKVKTARVDIPSHQPEQSIQAESKAVAMTTPSAYLEQLERKLIEKKKIKVGSELIPIYYRGDYVLIKAKIPGDPDRIFLSKQGKVIKSYKHYKTRQALKYLDFLTNVEVPVFDNEKLKLLLEEGDYRILWKKGFFSTYYLVKDGKIIRKYGGSDKLDQVLLDLTLITERK